VREQGTTEPSFAECARTLLHSARVGTLSTRSERHPGYPFGSLAPYGVLADGSPTFLLSTLAVHTRNLLVDARASLLVATPAAHDDAPASARLTLVGTVTRIEDGPGREIARADYLARHASAHAWVDFGDFAFHRLEVAAVYWVAGFGSMGWVEPADYRDASPDPLCESAPGILAHMNADHREALVLYCRAFADVEVASDDTEMVGVDRLGFRVRAATAAGARQLRIVFPRAVATPDETRRALIEMLRDARARLGVA
jgi:heme oxygenase (biliverdin-IX-beta and delta-forming)